MTAESHNSCGLILGELIIGGREPDTGCALNCGHIGPHEFTATNGQTWCWETNYDCDCEHCKVCPGSDCPECEGEFCTTYWRKKGA